MLLLLFLGYQVMFFQILVFFIYILLVIVVLIIILLLLLLLLFFLLEHFFYVNLVLNIVTTTRFLEGERLFEFRVQLGLEKLFWLIQDLAALFRGLAFLLLFFLTNIILLLLKFFLQIIIINLGIFQRFSVIII